MSIENILETFVNEIKEIYGSRLRSVVLYGSRASGEATKKHSDYNLLLIIDELRFTDLKSLNKIIGKWLKKNNPPPLVFSTDRFKMSADVFPIEFIDMKEYHKILYGEDLFQGMEISLRNLRHECEFELKGKLLKLRQGYLITRGKTSEIRKLLIDSLSTFLIIFRNVIRLTGQTPPLKRLDSLNLIAEHAKISTEPFIKVLRMKEGDKEMLRLDPELILDEYIKEIEKVIDFVDIFVVK